jgi:predicted transposase YdaD
MELVASWEREGRIKGREEGLTEGRLEGQRDLLVRQLSRKFGLLPKAATARLAELSLAQLTALSEALLEFSELRDFERWLAALPPSTEDASGTDRAG